MSGKHAAKPSPSVLDQYVEAWDRIRVEPDFLADEYTLNIRAFQSQSMDSAETGLIRITHGQANRVLALLASDAASTEFSH